MISDKEKVYIIKRIKFLNKINTILFYIFFISSIIFIILTILNIFITYNNTNDIKINFWYIIFLIYATISYIISGILFKIIYKLQIKELCYYVQIN